MQDAFAYCAELVRAADRDRFIATLFASADRRGALHAVYAFNVEVARVRDVAREALPGEIRLQWWSDVINRQREGEASANPVAAALLGTMERHQLRPQTLLDLIEARRFDLYDDPMAGLAELEGYAGQTSSALFALAEQILGIAGVLRAFPVHVVRRQLYVPADILDRHQVLLADVFAARSSAALAAALAELRNLARRHLDAAREPMKAIAPGAIPAFLPLALVRPSLDRLDRGDPFAPKEIAPWRRQWLIWRAVRNPKCIAG